VPKLYFRESETDKDMDINRCDLTFTRVFEIEDLLDMPPMAPMKQGIKVYCLGLSISQLSTFPANTDLESETRQFTCLISACSSQ